MFLLWVLASTCVSRSDGARVDSCCKTEPCHLKCAATAVPGRVGLQMNVRSMSLGLLQSRVTPSKHIDKEADQEEEEIKKEEQAQEMKEEAAVAKVKEEKAEEVVKDMERMGQEEGQQQNLEDESWKAKASYASLNNQSADRGGTVSGAAAHAMSVMSLASSQVRQQPVQGRSLLRTAELKLKHIAGNHNDNDTTSSGLQPAYHSQVLSLGSASDANHTAAFVPLSSNGRWHNKWMRLLQLTASVHSSSRVMLAYRYVAAAAMRSSWKNWVICVAFFLVVILMCICFGGRKFNHSSALHAEMPQKKPARMENWLTPDTKSQLQPPVRPTSAQGTLVSLPPAPTHSHRSSFHGESIDCLCKAFVVPMECESILYVPVNPKQYSFQVLDQFRKLVIRVELKAGNPRLQEQRRVEVSTWDGNLIAQCVDSGDELQICRGNREYFAKLTKGAPDEVPGVQSHSSPEEGPRETWKIQTASGSEWFFHGNFESYNVEFVDRQGRLVALSQLEPAGEYLLRVAPMMDVSIVLCSLLAVYHLTRP